MSFKDYIKGLKVKAKASTTDEVLDKASEVVQYGKALNELNRSTSTKVVTNVLVAAEIGIKAIIGIRKVLGK